LVAEGRTIQQTIYATINPLPEQLVTGTFHAGD